MTFLACCNFLDFAFSLLVVSTLNQALDQFAKEIQRKSFLFYCSKINLNCYTVFCRCFCRKRDKSQKVQAATDSEVADQEESSNNNELPDKTFPNYLPHNAPVSYLRCFYKQKVLKGIIRV